MINPGEFISIAEDCGLILPLGEYVIETACRQLVDFARQGIEVPIAVNISMQQFEKADFADIVIGLLEKTGADPRTAGTGNHRKHGDEQSGYCACSYQ